MTEAMPVKMLVQITPTPSAGLRLMRPALDGTGA